MNGRYNGKSLRYRAKPRRMCLYRDKRIFHQILGYNRQDCCDGKKLGLVATPGIKLKLLYAHCSS